MESGHFQKLFEPVNIGSMEVKNRIVMPAMYTNLGTADGFVTEQTKAYYESRAEGGAGLIITEIVCIDFPIGRPHFHELSIDNDKYIPGMIELVNAIHRHGAKVALQLHHAGAETTNYICGGQAVGPSAVPALNKGVPHELSNNEIKRLVRCYAKAAERAKKSGFDGIEIHAAHYYLLAQFLSRRWNRRQDKYGGSLHNRSRFLLEIIMNVRRAVGPGFPILCRINGAEPGIEYGQTLEEAKEVAHRVEGASVDAIHVSALGGGAHALVGGPEVIEPGALVPLASEIKKIVIVPVIAVGRIHNPILAETILREGKADLVAIGRGLIADPELPQKAFSIRLEDIRPCICCLDCIENVVYKQIPIECSVNATVGKEFGHRIESAREKKTVIVIGGGPAGMEAARMAAIRGHKVTLYEKSFNLGGQLLYASIPPYKSNISAFVDYLVNQLNKLGVTIKLGKEILPSEVTTLGPDVVIIATGPIPLLPDIPQIEEANPVSVEAVLSGQASIGDEVIVIGGGMVGCETAEFLVDRGKKVTVLEILDRLAIGMIPVLRFPLLTRLREKGVTLFTGVKYEKIRNGELTITDKTGNQIKLKAETIIIATGSKPNDKWILLKEKLPELYFIGDCVEPCGIKEAIATGNQVACSI
jgi:2,4-dienoyl-CoA reductase-like NADH-dependent reductase (Old Yellow Enzyme family)/NADPH-dependent glutamate synthase beta subunit-like oxidoreductase